MNAAMVSRISGSMVALVAGVLVANVALVSIPSPDSWAWLLAAAVLIVTAGVGAFPPHALGRVSAWGLLGAEAFGAFTLLPLVALFTMATAPDGQFATTLLPRALDVSHFGAAVVHLGGAMAHSLAAAFLATVVALPLAAGVAYVVVVRRPAGAERLRTAFTVLLLAPTIVWAVPAGDLLTGLRGSPVVTAVGDLVVALPLAVWLLIGAFEQADWRLLEAARADGATWSALMFRVALPQWGMTILAVALLVFCAGCLDFAVGAAVTSGSGPLPAALLGTDPTMAAAVGLVWLLPMAIGIWLLAPRIIRLVGRS